MSDVVRPPRRRGPAPSPRVEADRTAPLVLAVDTSTAIESLALAQGDIVLAEVQMRRPKHRGAALAATIEALLGGVGRTIGDLSGIVVGIGPGAFTGLRVGLATVRGVAAALDLPVWGVSSAELWAAACRGAPEPVAVTLDARRGEVYAALYEAPRRGPLVERLPVATYTPAAWFERLAEEDAPVILVGDGARLHRAEAERVLGPGRILGGDGPSGPGTARAALDAVDRVLRGDPGPITAVRPLYLRAHDGSPARADGDC